MKRIILIAILLSSYILVFANHDLDKLYKNDILFLYDILKKNSRQLYSFDESQKQDILNSFNQLLKMSDTVKTKESFALLVQQALVLLNDGHASLVGKSTVKYYLQNMSQLAALGGVTPSDTLLADKNLSFVTDSIYIKVRCGLRFKYLNGEYFNVRPFSYNGQVVDAGEKLLEIEGVKVDDFVRANRHRLISVRYDLERKKWYDEMFFLSMPRMRKDVFTVNVGGKSVEVCCSQSMSPLQKEHSTLSNPYSMKIGSSILYLRIPAMFNEEFYKKEIHKGMSDSVEKVVLDIRGNRGGQDKVWMGIMAELIDEPLMLQVKIDVIRNEHTQKALDALGISYSSLNKVDTLYPSKTSKRFSGRIYILQDGNTYSAASSLSSIAWQYEKIKLVGDNLSRVGGKGITPLIFRLPNSGLVFRLSFTMDMSGKKGNELNSRAEVVLNENIENYLNRVLYNDCFSPSYIREHDKVIEFVKNDIVELGKEENSKL